MNITNYKEIVSEMLYQDIDPGIIADYIMDHFENRVDSILSFTKICKCSSCVKRKLVAMELVKREWEPAIRMWGKL